MWNKPAYVQKTKHYGALTVDSTGHAGLLWKMGSGRRLSSRLCRPLLVSLIIVSYYWYCLNLQK